MTTSSADFSWYTVLEILLGTLGSGIVIALLMILFGKWINKLKDHFEAE